MRIAFSIVAVLIILFLGCQHAAIAYRLRHDGLDPILLPPTTGDNTSPSVSIAIKHARQRTARRTECDITGDLISLHWAKSTAEVSFHSQSFFASGDQSPNQAGRGLYVDPLLAIDKFRSDLAERQSKGCFRAVENERLRRAIVENLPLPPPIAYFLQLGSYDVSGYFDLTPDFRMQVTGPIYRPGAEPSASTLLGYETANYSFAGEGNRMRLRLASASEVRIGGAPVEKRTVINELRFTNSAAYFRLFFMAEQSASRRVTRAILVSAPEQNKLVQAGPGRGTSADRFCAAVPAQVNCTVFPENVGVSPELRIRVNQKDAFVPVGGMVQEALNLPNDVDPPTSLQIFRPFRGHLIPIKFDPSSRDILKLVLLPGDQVTF